MINYHQQVQTISCGSFTVLPTFFSVDPANSSSGVFLGQRTKITVRRTRRKNIPTTAFLKREKHHYEN